MTNRLAGETSPYLLQHKDNPVDWWPWGAEAFAEAVRRDVPVLLSVGYAACHWCHVMAHESFEDEATARVMNERFVNIKVDREERPDVDAVHMDVVQAMTGSGGWPMTVFLTPQGHPFYGGTYFPPVQRHGMPAFTQVLLALSDAWENKRSDVLDQGREIVERLGRAPAAGGSHPPTAEDLQGAVGQLARTYDGVWGGFGGAPKFPPSSVLEMLLRHRARTGDQGALDMVGGTCEAMARGGMYDQLAGGFARYSVDAQWVVPHFEKMLYDNAQLARVYLHWWRETGSPLGERIARETCRWMLDDLLTDEGGFASALDADSLDAAGHLEEGAYYAWTPSEVGPEVAALCSVTPEGTFEHGRSTLQLRTDPPEWWPAERLRLLEIRRRRSAPARDDKVVASWNGLAIAALAEVGALLDEPAFVAAAERAADLLLRLHVAGPSGGAAALPAAGGGAVPAGGAVEGGGAGGGLRLLRTSRAGVAGRSAGVLEDYGGVAEGLLALHQVTGDARWLTAAGDLLRTVLAHFGDGAGGFYDTADDAEALISRPAEKSDGATASGLSLVAGALLTYAALTGDAAARSAVESALATVTPIVTGHLRFAGWSAAVAEALLAGPLEVAVVDRPDLLALARRATSPGAVVATGGALTEGRTQPAAYVCRGFVCELPTTDAGRLREQLRIRE